MKVGFTGAKWGMTPRQRQEVEKALISLGATELHHGDCIGADEQAHEIARNLGLRIVVHPPLKDTYRAWCIYDVLRPVYEYLVRDAHIVEETRWLIAAPRTHQEETRSGTWATVRR